MQRLALGLAVSITSFLCSSAFASGDIPSKLRCQLSDVGIPGSKAVASLVFVSGPDPILSVKGSEKELNFKIGRNNVAGLLVGARDGYSCTPSVTSNAGGFSFDYSCTQSITDVDGSKKTIGTLESKFELSKAGTGQLCQSLGENSLCWLIISCQ